MRWPPRLNLPYRPCVGIMLLNKENKVFIAQRVDTKGTTWQMPQGGIDSTETPWQAALREMKEEINTVNVRLIAETKEWITYDFPEKLHETLWGGRFFGQTQKWFLVEYLGQDDEINIHTRHPEFTEWRWVDATELPDLIVPFKRDLYIKLLEEFKPYLPIDQE